MRLRRILIALGVVIVLVDAGILAARSRDQAKPLSAADAVTRFRSTARTPTTPSTTTSLVPVTSTTVRTASPLARSGGRSPVAPSAAAPPPAPLPLPAEGVYVYTTTGGERVDILGGAHHDYPGETTITVRHAPCGTDERWQPLRERWDARRLCMTDRGEAVRAVTQHHEFFGRADERTFVCDAGAINNPRDPRPGATWTTVCRSDDAVGTTRVRAVGFEELVIGGARVRTFHFHSVTDVRGSSPGTQEYDDWMVVSTSLLVRRISTTDARAASPIGTAHYQEHYELKLTSLKPRT